VGVVDPDLNRPMSVAREFGCPLRVRETVVSAHSEVRAASVGAHCTSFCGRPRANGIGHNFLIEKPLASSLAEADKLVELAANHKGIAQVGTWSTSIRLSVATIPLLTQPMFLRCTGSACSRHVRSMWMWCSIS